MVQFNHRIFSDRDKILQDYKTKHGTTMQAIVNQMVDEYLERRGLLPQDDEE
jgi:primosomal protein N''